MARQEEDSWQGFSAATGGFTLISSSTSTPDIEKYSLE
jgi:hypothetical protein